MGAEAPPESYYFCLVKYQYPATIATMINSNMNHHPDVQSEVWAAVGSGVGVGVGNTVGVAVMMDVGVAVGTGVGVGVDHRPGPNIQSSTSLGARAVGCAVG